MNVLKTTVACITICLELQVTNRVYNKLSSSFEKLLDEFYPHLALGIRI